MNCWWKEMAANTKNPTLTLFRGDPQEQEARSKPPAPHHCGAVLSVADTVRLPHPLAHGAHVEGLLQLRTSRRDLPRLPNSLPGVRSALFLHGQQQAVKQPHRLLPINSGHSTRESYIQGWRREVWS